MTYHPTIQKTGEFATREIEIYEDLVRAVAERDGINLAVPRLKLSAETTAEELLRKWPRHRREPQNDVERLCEANVANEKAWAEHRQKIQAIRDAHKAATATPEPGPKVVTVTVRDELSRKLLKLTIPVEMVEVA